MIELINKFKIPTLLGLSIILLGLGSGLFLVLKEQVFLSQASPNSIPQNITLTNITENSVVISWQTNTPTTSFITFGEENPRQYTVLDDKDADEKENKPKPHLIHYVTLKNLLPKTTYQYRIVSGKTALDIAKFQTASPLANHTELTPIIGSVMDGDIPLDEGVVYLSIPDAITQSTQIKSGGNFLIPLSQIAKTDLSDTFSPTEDVIAKLVIQSSKGEANVLFKLRSNLEPPPPIKLGQNIDLTLEETPQPSPTITDLGTYDLNTDGKINAADNAIILQNFGKKPKDKKADLNSDGVVNQKDLDLMSQKLKSLGN